MGPRRGASPPMRLTSSWSVPSGLHPNARLWRDDSSPLASFPSDHHSDRAKRAHVLGPLKAGVWQGAGREERLERRPIDRFLRRRAWVGRRNAMWALTTLPPYRACYGVTHVRPCTGALSPLSADTLSEGWAATSLPPVSCSGASGWSGCRVGLPPTGKRHLVTAHARNGSRRLRFDHLIEQGDPEELVAT